ncbi:NAD(P)-binding domain-containing protein [Microbacterium sp.]|uniref:NAD(P)-dependent oxidoreductase n=1 Tax=Microbacterium sp. TaxID=51671 RepID=UPI0028111A48|nr:NAD(P)-binding domain-containing protein [Microbacterium sp.]
MSNDKQAVTMIGLGPMGQAMARALLAAGHPVTVWNRTASRADDLVAAGAVRADSPAEALRASHLVLLSLTDYQAMWDILGEHTDALSGRTLVNLSSEGPAKTRAAAEWASAHGATLIVGGVMVPAEMIGTEAASAYYSGPSDVFERIEETLSVIASPLYLGEEISLAQLMYQAQLHVFLTSLSALMQATALLNSAGMSATEALPHLIGIHRATPELGMVEAIGKDIDAGVHPGEMATATMMGATADHIVQASEEAGLDLALPRAVLGHYRRVVDDGKGQDSWTRIIDGIRDPRAAETGAATA